MVPYTPSFLPIGLLDKDKEATSSQVPNFGPSRPTNHGITVTDDSITSSERPGNGGGGGCCG